MKHPCAEAEAEAEVEADEALLRALLLHPAAMMAVLGRLESSVTSGDPGEAEVQVDCVCVVYRCVLRGRCRLRHIMLSTPCVLKAHASVFTTY